jgi:hypothetical protein
MTIGSARTGAANEIAMITSFEVGSVFQIVDGVTPTIQRISREMSELVRGVAE